MNLRRGQRKHLADDASLVLWTDAARELGLRAVWTVRKYVRQGRLRRHHSRRGVTRESLQSFVAGMPNQARRGGLPTLARRIAEAVAAAWVLPNEQQNELAHLVLTELLQAEQGATNVAITEQ